MTRHRQRHARGSYLHQPDGMAAPPTVPREETIGLARTALTRLGQHELCAVGAGPHKAMPLLPWTSAPTEVAR
jgi:hypothetical protein